MGPVQRVPSRRSRREVGLRLKVRGRTLVRSAIRTRGPTAVVERTEPAAVALSEGLAAFRAAVSERPDQDAP